MMLCSWELPANIGAGTTIGTPLQLRPSAMSVSSELRESRMRKQRFAELLEVSGRESKQLRQRNRPGEDAHQVRPVEQKDPVLLARSEGGDRPGREALHRQEQPARVRGLAGDLLAEAHTAPCASVLPAIHFASSEIGVAVEDERVVDLLSGHAVVATRDEVPSGEEVVQERLELPPSLRAVDLRMQGHEAIVEGWHGGPGSGRRSRRSWCRLVDCVRVQALAASRGTSDPTALGS